MKPSDMPWKLNQSKTLNGYTLRIESADGLTIGEFYGSTNPMWDFVPGAMQAQENARIVIDASCRIAELEKQLAEKDEEIEHLDRTKAEWKNTAKLLDEKLAVLQAVNQQYREALEDARTADDLNYCASGAYFTDVIDKTLALPQDTTALESMIAKAGEVMKEKSAIAATKAWYQSTCYIHDITDSIRALHSVTLEDLK